MTERTVMYPALYCLGHWTGFVRSLTCLYVIKEAASASPDQQNIANGIGCIDLQSVDFQRLCNAVLFEFPCVSLGRSYGFTISLFHSSLK